MPDSYITIAPNIMGGTPCLQGTRLSVYAIAERLRGGETAEEIIAGYPNLTAEMVIAAAAYAEKHPLRERSGGRPWRKAKSSLDAA